MTHPEARDAGLERILFLSDGVFAIAITLLVIDLRLPDLAAGASAAAFTEALLELGPKVVAYLLSFAVIGLYWLAHWRRYHFIERADGRLALVNLLLLGAVALIPFPTALLGEHGDRPIVIVIYAVTLSLAGLLGTTTWLYAVRAGLASPGLSSTFVRSAALRGLSVPLVMLGSLLFLPVLGPDGVTLSWILIFPLQVLISRGLAPTAAATTPGPTATD